MQADEYIRNRKEIQSAMKNLTIGYFRIINNSNIRVIIELLYWGTYLKELAKEIVGDLI